MKEVILIALLLLGSALTIMSIEFNTTTEQQVVFHKSILFTRKVEMTPVVAEFSASDNATIGFSIDDDKLNFGIIPQGGSSRKTITIRNDNPGPVKISLVADRRVKDILQISDPVFHLLPQDSKIVELKAVSSQIGNFSGSLQITALASNSALLNWMVLWL